MTRVSSVEVVKSLPVTDRHELQVACDMADQYRLQGIPMSVIKSNASLKFGQFMETLSLQERQEIYAVVGTIMTASKLA